MQAWVRFVRETVRRFSAHADMLQIGEEPNAAGGGGNGEFPNVRQAVVEGVLAANDEARRGGFNMHIGINGTLSFGPVAEYWPSLAALGGPSFVAALDYAGLDFFPDVFRPILPAGSLDAIRDAVVAVLGHYRNVNLASATIPMSTPLHITENGWPTSATRPEDQQADVLETIIRAVHAQRGPLNITHYELFDLRDADSANPDMGFHFGVMRDDYSPKPAFQRYRQLIGELG